MLDGDEYEDHLLGDPNQLDDIIEGRDLNQPEDEVENGAEEAGDEDQDDGDDKKVKPKRTRVLNPQPKLDTIRLTGPRGIVAIENLFKDFKFYGAGYEDQDLNRVMKRLELWGNRLFPKFQFDDLLEKVEKLGHKRPVLNFVSKIRMGIVTEDSVAETPKADDDMEVDNDDLNEDVINNTAPNDDVFDQLLTEQQTQVSTQPIQSSLTPTKTETIITDEQRERMLQNRLLAEKRRLARIKAQQEKVLQSAENNEFSHIEKVSEVDIHTNKGNETISSSHTALCDHVEDSANRNVENREKEVMDNSENVSKNVILTNSQISKSDSLNSDGIILEVSNHKKVAEKSGFLDVKHNNLEEEGDLRDRPFSDTVDVNFVAEDTQMCVVSDKIGLLEDGGRNEEKSEDLSANDIEMKE